MNEFTGTIEQIAHSLVSKKIDEVMKATTDGQLRTKIWENIKSLIKTKEFFDSVSGRIVAWSDKPWFIEHVKESVQAVLDHELLDYIEGRVLANLDEDLFEEKMEEAAQDKALKYLSSEEFHESVVCMIIEEIDKQMETERVIEHIDNLVQTALRESIERLAGNVSRRETTGL